MHTYENDTGEWRHNGKLMAVGYSGKGEWKNKGKFEALIAKGPIPVGKYKIGPPWNSKRTGKFVMSLTPIGHDAQGRSSFQIHGDSIKSPGTASSGCIILHRAARDYIAESGDNILEVT